MTLRKFEEVTLSITAYAYEGRGIAKVLMNETDDSPYVYFVKGAYPGDTVRARLVKIKKNFAEAEAVEILTPSVFRTAPRCRHFGVCGGCKQQDMLYEQQIAYKQEQASDHFTRIGQFSDFIVEPILPSPETFYYRNKMDFSIEARRWFTKEEIGTDAKQLEPFGIGLHIPGVFDKVLNISECFLQSELSSEIVNFTRTFFAERDEKAYQPKPETGYLRNLVIRQSGNTKDLMVNLVTAFENDALMETYTASLLERFPAITTVVNNINTRKSMTAFGEYEKVFHGEGFIYDTIGKYTYRISANSFFQTNTKQAGNLYAIVSEYAQLTGTETVYDLYCGAGTIGISLSGSAKQVIGFESAASALADAAVNAEINKISSISFRAVDLDKPEAVLTETAAEAPPDVLILDPPRSGLHKNTIQHVLRLDAKRIIYVSCNPATQARDAQLLAEGGYRLIKMRSVDMFPHTFHIENVALFEKY